MTERWQDRFAECGTEVVIEPDVYIEHPELFRVGDRVRLGRGFYSQGSTRVTIGPDSSFFLVVSCRAAAGWSSLPRSTSTPAAICPSAARTG